jgi:Flp pilus assembly protein TadD
MSCQHSLAITVIVALGMCLSQGASAGDLRITIPKRSRLTPVQRLNREGVEAVNKQQYEKAKSLFYKAYLFDPGDPFTLNNLGYVAELEGQVERAHRFYALASKQATDALIDRASSSNLEGESLQNAISAIRDSPMQVNRANVDAVRLLSKGRVREADTILRQALVLDPKNPFTLNNLGVAKEAQGEYAEALKYYDQAANTRVADPVVVTMNAAWRGKPLSDMAQRSAEALRARMKSLQSNQAKVALLNLRGVSAMNRNDWRAAWEDFSQAFRLGPDDAFSLNNQGYMAEMNGDLETAQEFYREARSAGSSNDRVGLATKPGAEGMQLSAVADESEGHVSGAIDAASETRRRNKGPIQLKRRDGRPLVPPTTPPPTTPQ